MLTRQSSKSAGTHTHAAGATPLCLLLDPSLSLRGLIRFFFFSLCCSFLQETIFIEKVSAHDKQEKEEKKAAATSAEAEPAVSH